MREISHKPDPTSSFLDQTLNRLKLEWRAWDDAFQKWKLSNVTYAEDHYKIVSDVASMAFALRWLEEKDIPWLLAKDYLEGNQAGKSLQYANLRLSKSNDGFYLEQVKKFDPFFITEPGIYRMNGGTISIELITSSPELISNDPLVQFINKHALTFPLLIRNTEPGDVFKPFGMKGKHKKLQDFLVDHKLDAFQKNQVKVLTSNEKILWVIGMRLDESARVLPEDHEMYKVSVCQARS
jgi:tRNA(Ile)-lysidine synthase